MCLPRWSPRLIDHARRAAVRMFRDSVQRRGSPIEGTARSDGVRIEIVDDAVSVSYVAFTDVNLYEVGGRSSTRRQESVRGC